jgi:T5SS/PEP-CTERM-associated repeat protein
MTANRTIRRKGVTAAANVAILLLLVPAANGHHGGVHQWIDPNGGLWIVPTNWDPDAVPSAGDIARFDIGDGVYTVRFGFLGNPLDVATSSLQILDDDVTFDLNGSTYTVGPSSIQIGETGVLLSAPADAATLTVRDGKMVAGTVALGVGFHEFPSPLPPRFRARGTLNVDGSAGNAVLEMVDGSNINVGDRGTGTLNVINGGNVLGESSVFDVSVWIGRFASGIGTVNVDGIGSRFLDSFAATVTVGGEGQGTLSVTNGGRAKADTFHVAATSGSTGDVLVDGGNLQFETMVVGGQGTIPGGSATLTIQNNGTAASSWGTGYDAVLRVLPGGHVTLNGGKLDVGTIDLADSANFDWLAGTLRLTGMDLAIGNGSELGALLDLTADHTLSLSRNLILEPTGTINLVGGTIDIEQLQVDPVAAFNWTSGTLQVRAGDIKVEQGGPLGSTRTLNGDSHLLVYENVLVGDSTDGDLTFAGGATGSAYGDTKLGRSSDATGSLTVEGENSTWHTYGTLTIGNAGDGRLTVRDDGHLYSRHLSMAVESNSKAFATANGRSTHWDVLAPVGNPVPLIVGGAGEAHVDVTGGAQWELTYTSAQMAAEAHGKAFVNVSGSGSRWESLHWPLDMGVGEESYAELNISDGGTARFQLESTISAAPQAHAVVNVNGVADGTPSLLAPHFLTVGHDGTGELNIRGGGRVETGDIESAIMDGAVARLLVDGIGSELIVDPMDMELAEDGEAFLEVRHGGRVVTAGMLLGDNDGTGHVMVRDDGSRIENDELVVGFMGTGYFDAHSGAAVDTATNVVVAERSTGVGTLTLRGSDTSLNATQGIYLGGSDAEAGGVASMTVADGATANVGQTLRIWDRAGLNLTGGILKSPTVDHTHGGQFDFTAGRLEVVDFQGTLQNNGGTLAPGNSVAVSNITGNYVQADEATLEIELAGDDNSDPLNPNYDRLDVGQIAVLDGTLELLLRDNFLPTLGSQFEILTTGMVRSGQFADVFAPVTNGLTFEVLYLPRSVVLEVVDAAVLAGDYNADGVVNSADYVVWRNYEGQGVTLPNEDPTVTPGMVTSEDLDVWRTHFGQTAGHAARFSSSRTAAVPEPDAMLIAMVGMLVLAQISSRR